MLLIQLEDALVQCIPPEQTGFIKNRSILRHIYSARSLWESFGETRGGAALRGRLKRSARAVQLFGRLAVLETHTLRY